MRADGATDLVVAVNDLEQPVGKPGLAQQLGHPVRCQRCQFRRLQDEGVARRQRRRGLPAGDLDRIVPGPDAGADTERDAFAIGDGIGIAPHVAGVGLRQRREEIHRIGAARHVGRHRLAVNLADVENLDPRQLFIMLAKKPRGPRQDLRPVMPAAKRPFLLRRCGDLDGAVENRVIRGLDPGDHLAGRRIDFIDCRGVAGKLFAADKRSADLHGALLLFEPPFHPDASHGATAKTRRHDCGHNLTLRRAARLRQAGRSHFREQADDRGHRRHG